MSTSSWTVPSAVRRIRANTDLRVASFPFVRCARPDAHDVVSFDLFDTLVVRRSATDEAIHRRVRSIAAAEGLLDDTVSTERYVEARRAATAVALRASDAPSLDHIHDHLAELLGLEAGGSEHLRGIESEEELADVVVVPGAVERLHELRLRGKHVAITSDLHLGGAVLGPRLHALGLLTDRDTLLVSSDVGASKAADGRLFDRLSEITGARPERILHRGNDAWADYAMPRRRGLQAEFDPSAMMNRYEAALATADDPSGLSALMAGVSRIVRLRRCRRVRRRVRRRHLWRCGADAGGVRNLDRERSLAAGRPRPRVPVAERPVALRGLLPPR